MRFLIVSAFLFLGCTHTSSNRSIATVDSLYANIEALGASNTAGSGASLPLLARLRDHLDVNVQDPALRRELQNKKTLIAGDYFFPTNYSFLMNKSTDQKKKVEDILKTWMKKYDLIMVGRLPLWSDLTGDQESFAKDFDSGGYKNILNVLERYREAVLVVNSTLEQIAAAHPQQVKILNLTEMVAVSTASLSGQTFLFPIPGKTFLPDKLHFSDAGQAFFLNSVVFPVWNAQIPPIVETGDVSIRSRLRALSRVLDTKERYLQGHDGGYWINFVDPSRFLNANSELRQTSAQDMGGLLKIQNVIHKNATARDGFPVYIYRNANPQKISLDLSSALFYTLIDLHQVRPGVYEGWGYDYWLSANIFNPLNPPKVNYRFVLTETQTPDIFDLEWTLYPVVKGEQEWLLANYETDQVRLSQVSSEIVRQLRENTSNYIKYKIQIQIQDLRIR